MASRENTEPDLVCIYIPLYIKYMIINNFKNIKLYYFSLIFI